MIAKCFDVQEMVETINIYDKNWKRILPKFHKLVVITNFIYSDFWTKILN